MAGVSTPSSQATEQREEGEALTRVLERNYSYATSSSLSLKERPTLDITGQDVPTVEKSEDKGPPNMEEIALKALHVDDDPTLNPWTFRVFFIGWSPPIAACWTLVSDCLQKQDSACLLSARH